MGTTIIIVGLMCIVVGTGYAMFRQSGSKSEDEEKRLQGLGPHRRWWLLMQSNKDVPEYTSKIETMIESGGYVWQHKLWRRWIMGRMMRMLTNNGTQPMDLKNYKNSLDWYGTTRCAHVCGRERLMQRMLLKANDQEELEERKRWYADDVLEKTYIPGEANEDFKNAYKGTGAYFTMKNLIMFHGCRFHVGDSVLDQEASLQYLKKINFTPSTTGDMMLETMMKLISDNNYTYTTYLHAIGKISKMRPSKRKHLTPTSAQ